MVSAAGALDSVGGKGQEAMDMDSSKPTKKIPRNKFVIACAVLASTNSILFGYGMFGVLDWNRRLIRRSGYDKFGNFYSIYCVYNCQYLFHQALCIFILCILNLFRQFTYVVAVLVP